MKHIIMTTVLIILWHIPATWASDDCEETKSVTVNELGMEIQKIERRCNAKSWLRANDEYRFRFPDGHDFNMTVRVDKNRSRFNGCRLGLSSALVYKNRKQWSGLIYVESEKKDTMPAYQIAFNFFVSHRHCGQNVPKGYELFDRDGKCFYRKVDCSQYCEPQKEGQWTDDGCKCDPKGASTGKRG